MAEQVLGKRFALRQQAARGGMGAVYRAFDLETERTVALKILTQDQPVDIERFRREAAMLGSVEHPHIVRYVAHGEDAGLYFLAEEWVEGITLAQHLRTVGVDVQQAVRVVTGIASALAAIHAAGMIHRDIKPANVILEANDIERIKLVDFGLARREWDSGLLTRTGTLVGTPSYMAPEQASGIHVLTPASDIWAVGCILYEALTGSIAFVGETPDAIRAKVLVTLPYPAAELCPELSPELADLLDIMLAKSAFARPADGAALLYALARLPPAAPGPRRPVSERASHATEVLRDFDPRPDSATDEMPTRADTGSARSYLFVGGTGEVADPDRDARMLGIAAKHALQVHRIDDGVALLAAPQPGREGARVAADAGAELQREVPDCIVCVFAQAPDASFGATIDRGARMLDRARMRAVFSPDDDFPLDLDEVVDNLLTHRD